MNTAGSDEMPEVMAAIVGELDEAPMAMVAAAAAGGKLSVDALPLAALVVPPATMLDMLEDDAIDRARFPFPGAVG